MRGRAHAIAVVTLASLVWAFVACVRFANPVQATHVVASAVLVSPIAFLLWAHARMAKGWRSHSWLALCSLPLAYLASFAAFLMAWFKPGWYGVLVLGAILLCLAGLCVLPLRRKKRKDVSTA